MKHTNMFFLWWINKKETPDNKVKAKNRKWEENKNVFCMG